MAGPAGFFAGGGAAAAASAGALATAGAFTADVIGGALGGGSGSGWSHLGSGLGSLAGGIYGNRSSARQAQLNRDFQQYMSDTAHQREVKDLKKAGLNPILSANSGASTPGGATAAQWDVGTPAVGSALQARINKAQTQQMSALARTTKLAGDREIAQKLNLNTQTGLYAQNTATARQTEQLVKQQTGLALANKQTAIEQAKQAGMQTSIMKGMFPGNLHEATLWSGNFGAARRYADIISGGKGAGGVIDTLNPLKIWNAIIKRGK